MDVLVTGAYGKCGTAIIDHLHDHDRYDFTYYNRSDRSDDHPYGGYDTVVGDVADAEKLTDAAEGQNALVHLAANPHPEGRGERYWNRTWSGCTTRSKPPARTRSSRSSSARPTT